MSVRPCSSAWPDSAHSQQPAPYELVDLATPYTAFWDETQKLPTAERVAAFKTRFDKLLPGYYSIERVTWTTAEKYDARIARSFEKFPEIRERFTAATANFSRLLAPAHQELQADISRPEAHRADLSHQQPE